MAGTALGEYLRSRRAVVGPRAHGLPGHGTRRVAGLRREEVAVVAGVSVDYYVRLEQGRETSPSAQVLDALARALCLDDDARLHLRQLAGQGPRASSPTTPEHVDPRLRRLLDTWPGSPAIVLGRAFDVLATNRLGDALFSSATSSPNYVESMFLGLSARSFYVDWELVAENTVAGLRLAQGAAPDDARVRQVVEGLLHRSPDFARMWRRHDARRTRLESKRLLHPDVGPLTVGVHAFDVRAAPGQELVVYSAEPGSTSERALGLLGAPAAAVPAQPGPVASKRWSPTTDSSWSRS